MRKEATSPGHRLYGSALRFNCAAAGNLRLWTSAAAGLHGRNRRIAAAQRGRPLSDRQPIR
jgi:hypothetical protein